MSSNDNNSNDSCTASSECRSECYYVSVDGSDVSCDGSDISTTPSTPEAYATSDSSLESSPPEFPNFRPPSTHTSDSHVDSGPGSRGTRLSQEELYNSTHLTTFPELDMTDNSEDTSDSSESQRLTIALSLHGGITTVPLTPSLQLIPPEEIPRLNLSQPGQTGFFEAIATFKRLETFFREDSPVPDRLLPGYHHKDSHIMTHSRRQAITNYYSTWLTEDMGSCTNGGRRRSARLQPKLSAPVNL